LKWEEKEEKNDNFIANVSMGIITLLSDFLIIYIYKTPR
jgi:hypothetical protein